MRDLLIRLDQRVVDGFETVRADFAKHERETENLKTRVGKLETDLGGRSLLIEQHKEMIGRVDKLEDWQAEAKGVLKAGVFIKSAIMVAIALLAYLGWKIDRSTPSPKNPSIEAVQAAQD